MLPALTAHLKAVSPALSVLLQTALARLLPCLWSAAPPDKLFHLPPHLVIMSVRPQWCHCSRSSSSCFSKQRWCVFHTSRCSLTRPCEVCHTPVWPPQHRRCESPRPGVALAIFFFFWVGFVFSAVTKRRLLSASTVMTLKDTMANLGLGWFSYCPQAEIQYKAI